MTLYTALVTVSKLAAPMIPFMTEEIYLNLVRSLDRNAPESVHLCDFPKADPPLWIKNWKKRWKKCWISSLWDRACQKYGKYKEPPAHRHHVCEGRKHPERFL